MEIGFVQFLCNFGLGAVFAGVMFVIYRGLVKQLRQDRMFMEDRQNKVIEDYRTSVNENTKILNELLVWLKAKNGNRS